MSQTQNLKLPLFDDDAPFDEWSSGINQNKSGTDKSAFQKIDEFAGHIYGVSGSFSIAPTAWSNKSHTVAVAELGENDAIFISPATEADRDLLNKAQIFASCSKGAVAFSVKEVPTAAINLKFFITRGKA